MNDSQSDPAPPAATRGRLRIYLGYAAGVGKTYMMLTAALRCQARGVDVVVGLAETHGAAETMALLQRLPQQRPRTELLANRPVHALDLDALLQRRPQLVLVDDLARRNPPGSRHAQRYQDVADLLDEGIDVYATLDVQHLESLKDVVARITGLAEAETVPDDIVDQAAELTLVDRPVAELLQQLTPAAPDLSAAEAAARRRFFRSGNLAALREIALRRAADRVDEEMRAYMQSQAIAGPWPARERILVCVSPSPQSERLVRTTRRLAQRLNAEWVAAYVETAAAGDAVGREQVARTLQLAERLGAQTIWLSGRSVADTLLDFAQRHSITRIVAGKSLRPRWRALLRGGSIVDRLVQQSGEVDVYVISAAPARAAAQPRSPAWRWPDAVVARSLLAVGLVTLATALGLPLRNAIAPTNLLVIYVLAVIFTAVWLGRVPAVAASLLSVMAFDFVFVPPYFTVELTDAEYLLTFVGLLAVGMVVGTLTAQARAQEQVARRQESQTSALYALSRRLATVTTLEDIGQAVTAHVQETLGYPAALYAATAPLQPPTLIAQTPGYAGDEASLTIADWVLRRGQPAGCLTDTMADSPAHWMPLSTSAQVAGVLAVLCAADEALLTGARRRLLTAIASQAAVALEKAQLAEQARHARLLEETDQLKTALLNAVSHDLRTPLAAITGVLSTLHDDMALLDEGARHELVYTAWAEARRLNRLVGNLLDMTRLEAGALKIVRQEADIEDLVGSALAQLPGRLQGRAVEIVLPADLPPVEMDFTLMVQVLVNLLDNAVKYSPSAAPISVTARVAGREMVVAVEDRGPGLPPGDPQQLFTRFFRVDRDGVGGTGLGLSIAHGIVHALGGRIWASDRPGGGASFAFALPLTAAEASRPQPDDTRPRAR